VTYETGQSCRKATTQSLGSKASLTWCYDGWATIKSSVYNLLIARRK